MWGGKHMPDVNTTVFISHRRENSVFHARAVFMDLRDHGYDVFLDAGHAAGDVPRDVLLNQIAARVHFILILVPGSLERCAQPDDPLRKEIEQAIESGRHIIPISVGGFDFSASQPLLSGSLARLPDYNGLALHHESFDAAMDRLRSGFLKETTDIQVTSPPEHETSLVREAMQALGSQPRPTRADLSAEEYFAQAYRKRQSGDTDGAIDDYSAVIALKPSFYRAYYNRGLAHYDLHQLGQAIADFGEAVRLNPEYVKAYYNRGLAQYHQGNHEAAEADFSEVLRHDSQHASAYNNRGLARKAQGDFSGAVADYTLAVRMDPGLVSAYSNRGNARQAMNDLSGAIADYQIYLDRGGGLLYDNQIEIEKRITALKKASVEGTQPTGIMGFLRSLFGLHKPPATESDMIADSAPDDVAAPPTTVTGIYQIVVSGKQSVADDDDGIVVSASDTARSANPLQVEVDLDTHPLRFCHLSDVGKMRSNNQDAVLSLFCASTCDHNLPDCGLFIVADGMGGYQEGEKASAVALETLSARVLSDVFVPALNPSVAAIETLGVLGVMEAGIKQANEAVIQQIEDGGTTLTAAVLIDDLAYIAHVGDSRAYIVSGGTIEQVTRDHSLVQRLIELGQVTPEEAVDHDKLNVLYRALGQSEMIDVDTLTRRLSPRSRLVLCSDGLWGQVPTETILDMVVKYDDPCTACRELVRMANDAGGPDNITVLIVHMPD